MVTITHIERKPLADGSTMVSVSYETKPGETPSRMEFTRPAGTELPFDVGASLGGDTLLCVSLGMDLR